MVFSIVFSVFGHSDETMSVVQINMWKFIYLKCGERYEEINDFRSYTHNLNGCEIKGWKKSGLNGIRTHDLCDTGAVLYQLSYQAIWELFTLWNSVLAQNRWVTGPNIFLRVLPTI